MNYIDSGLFKIIPIHMNVIFNSEYFSFTSNLNNERFITMVEDINNNDNIILDFKDIKNTLVSDFICFFVEWTRDRSVLMINFEDRTYDLLKNNFEDKFINFDDLKLKKCLKTQKFPNDVELPTLMEYEYLSDYLEKKCKEILFDNKNKPESVSSNVYTNINFDVKRLFGNIDTVKIAVYLMARKLIKMEKNDEIFNYKLLSSSFNGCILANIIALIIGKKHISIPHLGPGFTVEDNRYLDYIQNGDKFIYIYDFIALGNEQKTISVVASLLDSEIIYSLGLTYYKPNKKFKGKTISVIDFNKIIEENKVHIAADENDLNILTGRSHG